MSNKYNSTQQPALSPMAISVEDIIELNRKAAKDALDAQVLHLRRELMMAIGTSDVGSCHRDFHPRDNQAAIMLMAQLTKDPRVQGSLTGDAGNVIFSLDWDLTRPKSPEPL
jgi:hypothetical protein